MSNINTSQNSQEVFWAREYASEYINKNSKFDHERGALVWKKMLSECQSLSNYLELGCNIGRNIEQIKMVEPNLRPSIIEISKPAFEFVTKNYELEYAFNGSILESSLPRNNFDLTFTMGVLIHVHPSLLLEHMQRMFDYSRRYILIGEYFSRVASTIKYQGQDDKLFKCDFGRAFIENHNVKLVDYGFVWGYLHDNAGFDDINWWLFEKDV